MTVAALPSTASYIEDGVTTSFPVPFRFKAASDLVVERLIGGAAVLLALGVDYSVDGGETDDGGTLTRAVATNGATLQISRRTARRQPMVYTNGDRFPAKSHEEALDRATLIAQEQDATTADLAARALMLPPGEAIGDLPPAAARRGRVMMFDAAQGALLLKDERLFAPGAPGPAGPTHLTLAEFKAAPISNQRQSLKAPGIVPGDYFFDDEADYTGQADDVNIIKADNTALSVGAWVRQRAGGVNFDGRSVDAKLREFVSVKDARFAGGAKGDGVTDDTVALQAAFNAAVTLRGLFFPPGRYCISDTLKAPVALSSFQFSGSSGYDGVRGPINFGLATSLLWTGPADQTKAMVQFNQSSGVRWKGISLNCDGKAGFGLQFMSTSPETGGVKCIVENCSIHYARLDGIIVGQQGVPSAPPAGRQFFGNVFRNLTFYGCLQSSIHINEWNADQQLFDSVMAYFDDRPNPLPVDNMFWFDHGGQWSRLINCQVGGLTVTPGFPHSGFMIRNQGSDNSISGAFGLLVDNCWQEGEGGFYYGVTSTNDNKGFTFINCASFTSNPANPSVFIDKGTGDRIAHTFIGCSFASDIKVGTPAFRKDEIELVNCTFSAGRGLVDAEGRRSLGGVFVMGATVGGVIIVPRFVNTLLVTLSSNIAAVYAEGVGKMGDKITVIVTQDATGSRTINWSGGSMSTLPAIPQPGTAAGAKTIYTFTSDGSAYYLTSVVGAAA